MSGAVQPSSINNSSGNIDEIEQRWTGRPASPDGAALDTPLIEKPILAELTKTQSIIEPGNDRANLKLIEEAERLGKQLRTLVDDIGTLPAKKLSAVEALSSWEDRLKTSGICSLWADSGPSGWVIGQSKKALKVALGSGRHPQLPTSYYPGVDAQIQDILKEWRPSEVILGQFRLRLEQLHASGWTSFYEERHSVAQIIAKFDSMNDRDPIFGADALSHVNEAKRAILLCDWKSSVEFDARAQWLTAGMKDLYTKTTWSTDEARGPLRQALVQKFLSGYSGSGGAMPLSLIDPTPISPHDLGQLAETLTLGLRILIRRSDGTSS